MVSLLLLTWHPSFDLSPNKSMHVLIQQSLVAYFVTLTEQFVTATIRPPCLSRWSSVRPSEALLSRKWLLKVRPRCICVTEWNLRGREIENRWGRFFSGSIWWETGVVFGYNHHVRWDLRARYNLSNACMPRHIVTRLQNPGPSLRF